MEHIIEINETKIDLINLGKGVANRVCSLFGYDNVTDEDYEDLQQEAIAYTLHLISVHTENGFISKVHTPFVLYFSFALKKAIAYYCKNRWGVAYRTIKNNPQKTYGFKSFEDFATDENPDFDILERGFGVADQYDFFTYPAIVEKFKSYRLRGGKRTQDAAERDAKIVWLLHLGYENQEIASILDMSYESVKTYRKRIKSALRGELQETEPEQSEIVHSKHTDFVEADDETENLELSALASKIIESVKYLDFDDDDEF